MDLKEDRVRRHEAFLREVQPYNKLLMDYHNLKTPIIKCNFTTGEITVDYGPDTEPELRVKKLIDEIKNYYLGEQS